MKTLILIAVVATSLFSGATFAVEGQKDVSAINANPAHAMLKDEQNDTDALAIPFDSSEMEDEQDEKELKALEEKIQHKK